MNQIWSVNQAVHVQTADVSKLLYQLFHNIYPDSIAWLFYTTWNFDPVAGDVPVGRSAQSYNLVYTVQGSYGVTENWGWTIFWLSHPIVMEITLWTKVYEQMFVDSGAIEELVKSEAPLNDDIR